MNKPFFLSTLFFFLILSCSSNEKEDVIPSSPATPTTTSTSPEDSDTTSDPEFNILFIGNSLTYFNDLPKLVKENAKSKGIIIETSSITYGGYAIIDHWEDGDVQDHIATGLFDFVIIQQGPSSQPYGREVLIEYGKLYKELCDTYGAKLAYYMVWPSRTYYYTFNGVIKNHRDAASINNALLCPVGEVWKAHFDATNNFDYYGSDGFHPSMLGSQVAADVIVESLFE